MNKLIKFVSVMLLCTLTALNVFGNNLEKECNKILFIVDVSGSMRTNDKERLTNEVMKMFVDGTSSTNTEIGFITYNDSISDEYPLTSLDKVSNRNSIKKAIDKIVISGSTDIGMAIKYGVERLASNITKEDRPVVILISDGETDLTGTKTGRTLEDSKKDESIAIEKAKKANIPIYAIGLSSGGMLGMDYLKSISSETNGKSYEIQNSKELLDLFNTLFYETTKSEIMSVGTLKGTGEEQSISVKIPHNHTYETNIIIQSNESIDKVRSEHKSSDINVYTSNKYTSLKVLNPLSDDITIKLTTKKDEEVKISLVNFVNIKPNIEDLEDLSKREIQVVAKLYEVEDNNKSLNSHMYEGLVGELVVTDETTGERKTFDFENTGTEFVTTYINSKKGSHTLQAFIKGVETSYASSSLPKTFNFTSSVPKQILNEKLNVLIKKETEIDLTKYFLDVNDEALNYEIISNDENITEVTIIDSKLLLKPKSKGNDLIQLKVFDGRGEELLSEIEVNVMPFIIYYKTPILCIMIIFIALLASYIILKIKKEKPMPVTVTSDNVSKKSKFKEARFEGYFLNTLSGNDIPVLHWNSSYINNRHGVSLGELFFMLDVTESLEDAYKINFESGANNTVVFYHETECIITISNKDIVRGKKVVLNYDDKIYIIFSDHQTEIEIRYKRARANR